MLILIERERSTQSSIFLIAFFYSSVSTTQIPVPESLKYVNDLTGTLTNSEVDTLTSQIRALIQKGHAQLIVLVVDATGDEIIEQYATQVFNNWRPDSRDRDDGVLLLVAWQDHVVRVEIGYRLKGTITDVQPGKIIHNSIIPAFKKGDLTDSLQKGINNIENRLTGNSSATMAPTDHPLPFNDWWALLVWAIVPVFISVKGYIEMLGVICLTAIVLTFALPVTSFSGSWRVPTALLCLATPFLTVAITFTSFDKKVRDSMRGADQPSHHTRGNSSFHYSSSSSFLSDSDNFSGDGNSSGGGDTSGRW